MSSVLYFVNYSLTALSIALIIALSALIDSINYSTIILKRTRKNWGCAYQNLDTTEFVVAIRACVCKPPHTLRKKTVAQRKLYRPLC